MKIKIYEVTNNNIKKLYKLLVCWMLSKRNRFMSFFFLFFLFFVRAYGLLVLNEEDKISAEAISFKDQCKTLQFHVSYLIFGVKKKENVV